MPGAVRGLKVALNSTGKYKFKVGPRSFWGILLIRPKASELSIDHLVVGGGELCTSD